MNSCMKLLRSRVAVVVLLLAGALQANANACTSAATNLVAGADYSSCVDGDVSGAMCTPTCLAGYAATAAAAGFALTCDAGDGSFDGADATLSCDGITWPIYLSIYLSIYTYVGRGRRAAPARRAGQPPSSLRAPGLRAA